MDNPGSTADLDGALKVADALERDKLDRRGFATSVVAALNKVGRESALVVSVEGDWGSGKTSTLAMIEALLLQKETPPVIVHFNPWLVGDRDVLLRLFLSKIATAVKLTDHASDGKKVAKELKAYSHVFDVIKIISGAEPYASFVKSAFAAVGELFGAVSDYKTPDIESRKQKVEKALREFGRPIIVFIDDIDRLFPNEVFEMVRIIKAVGDLPNVGYVLAWDPKYVQKSLECVSVPQSSTYIDKIVQLRMSLPALSIVAKETLINEILGGLAPEALEDYFPDDRTRLSLLYFSGLRELVERPRDVVRIFNVLAAIEPPLRGEITLADIFGLATLMVKAPAVFDLLHKNPRWFVGHLPRDIITKDKSEEIIKRGTEQRDAAYEACGQPDAVRELTEFLFPRAAPADNRMPGGRARDADGRLASPERLVVALQLSVSQDDVSLVSAKQFLLLPARRADITATLTARNCNAFLQRLGDVADAIADVDPTQVEEICLAIARIVDIGPFPERAKNPEVFSIPPEMTAVRSIQQVVRTVTPGQATIVAGAVVKDPQAVTVATEIMARSYLERERAADNALQLPPEQKEALALRLGENILLAAQQGRLLRTCNPGPMLWDLARLLPDACPGVLAALREHDQSLDGFALEILRNTFDSTNGASYAVPDDPAVIEAYWLMPELRLHAEDRLRDVTLTYPARAAWRSVVEDKPIYGKDGSVREH